MACDGERAAVEGLLRRRDLAPRVRERAEMVKAALLGWGVGSTGPLGRGRVGALRAAHDSAAVLLLPGGAGRAPRRDRQGGPPAPGPRPVPHQPR